MDMTKSGLQQFIIRNTIWRLIFVIFVVGLAVTKINTSNTCEGRPLGGVASVNKLSLLLLASS